MGSTLALGFLFGALLLYVSIAPALFFDLYGIDDTFPLYFAIIALGLGIAAYFTSRLVVHSGMYRLSLVALAGPVLLAAALLAATAAGGAWPPFGLLVSLCSPPSSHTG